MSSTIVRTMAADDEYFVSTCSHVNERAEIDECGKRRLAWFKEKECQGLSVKVALAEGKHVGFLYLMPIELCPWGPLGHDLMVMPCLYVLNRVIGKRIGSKMVEAALEETKRQNKKALVTTAYYHDFWFMPATYFEIIGFEQVKRRENISILWKVIDPSAEPPDFLDSHYNFNSVPGKVVIDLFWNCFCLTSATEAQRVREVAAEFGGAVIVNEYPADNITILMEHQIPRGIFINGEAIGWGYEAPRDGLRKAIEKAIAANRQS